MLETYVSMVLGTGVRLQIIPEESSKSQLAAANKVEKLWNEWVEETEYFTELRSMIFARVQDGESFGVLETAINDVPVQLQMRAYEADFFGDPGAFGLPARQEPMVRRDSVRLESAGGKLLQVQRSILVLTFLAVWAVMARRFRPTTSATC